MIADKLTELKSLDPRLWTEISEFGYIGGEFNGNYDRWAQNYDDSPPESDYIQGCIQREIERRKWNWESEKFHNTHYVKVTIPFECWSDEVFRSSGKSGIADIFLDTYLKAIKWLLGRQV
jgi:hypothetical protein